MKIQQIRALLLLGNLAAGGGLLVAGGRALFRLVLPPAPQKTVDIPRPKVDVARRESKAKRETFRNIWTLPVVPDMQPDDRPPQAAGPSVPTGTTVEEAENLLRQTFELRLTNPHWSNPLLSVASVLPKTGGQGAEEQLITIHDKPAGHEVLEIHDDHVLFLVRDVRARLRFEDPGQSWQAATAAATRATGAGAGVPATVAAAGPSGAEPFVAKAQQVSAVLWHVSRDEARYLSDNYQRIVREVAFAPHRGSDGKVDGIELTDVAETSLVAKRGFQARDVIKSVNGEPVNDMRALPEVLRRQQGKHELVIVYSRRGVDQTVTYAVK